jgi:CheY-like chemotaxis protein
MANDPVVYVIDDDEAARDSLACLLGGAQFVVGAYDSAKALLDALPTLEQGCVISDIRMPGIDGMEFLRRLKALGVPFDLSRVVFVATANMLDSVPGPPLDRMEIISLAGYTEDEKLEIARRYLVRRQLEAKARARRSARLEQMNLPRLWIRTQELDPFRVMRRGKRVTCLHRVRSLPSRVSKSITPISR